MKKNLLIQQKVVIIADIRHLLHVQCDVHNISWSTNYPSFEEIEKEIEKHFKTKYLLFLENQKVIHRNKIVRYL